MRVPGSHSSISFKHAINETYSNLAIGIETSTQCDVDGDGEINSLDLDSDDDGCSDANEYYNSNSAEGSDGNQYFGNGNPPTADTNGKVVGASHSWGS